jgi:hypothetical protein
MRMRQLKILYLDREKDKALFRALNKHGVVFHAEGLNQALFLMAESDFDYFFIDADVPQSQAFLKHVRHDPELAPPQGVVLLTDNEEEDCAAWQVDAFITRRTATGDLPYIFSHLKAEKLEPPRILRLAEALPNIEQEEAPPEVSVQSEEPEIEDIRSHLSTHKDAGEMRSAESVSVSFNDVAVRRSPAKLVIVAAALITLVAWLFLWGPLASKQAKERTPATKRKTVDAEATRAEQIKKYQETTVTSPSSAPVAGASSQPSSPSGQTEAAAAAPDTPAENQRPSPTPAAEPTPAPAPEPANQSPSVSISGPSQVMRGSPASFSASSSDPDGDSVSLSWSPSQTVTSESEGSITVTVTATDSHGASTSDSATVTFL